MTPRLIGKINGMKSYEVRFTCLLCEDTGFVTLLHPDMIARIKAEGTIEPEITCAAVCTCDAGQKKAITRLPCYGDKDWHIRRNEADCFAKAAEYDHNVWTGN